VKVSGDWLTAAGTQALCAALGRAGHQALFVGGCVRNALMGLPVADVDIATDAAPGQVVAIAEAAGFQVIPTGIDHGTVTVIAEGLPHEVTTFRRDVATDGRHAVVAFTADVAADAARRDLTMNALYARADGTVIDPLGGLPDLLARRVRFVGDADLRIREDYLRILRFFRFHARYGDPTGGIDVDGLAACARHADKINTLSRERVGAEMRKLLSAYDPAPALAAMAQSGALAQVLPGADPQPLGPLVNFELDADPDWMRRLAAIGGQDVADRLRLSRAEIREYTALRDAIGSMESPAVLGWRLGLYRGSDAVILRASVLGQPMQIGIMEEVQRGAQAQLPVTAADLMPALQGPALGARMKEIESLWLASDLTLTRAELLA
jgi:poly(A) polymerase